MSSHAFHMMRFHELKNKGNRSHYHLGFELVICMLDSRDLPAAQQRPWLP